MANQQIHVQLGMSIPESLRRLDIEAQGVEAVNRRAVRTVSVVRVVLWPNTMLLAMVPVSCSSEAGSGTRPR
jgi:stage V sporulation protein SpoVS